jgi:hypothetical protein
VVGLRAIASSLSSVDPLVAVPLAHTEGTLEVLAAVYVQGDVAEDWFEEKSVRHYWVLLPQSLLGRFAATVSYIEYIVKAMLRIVGQASRIPLPSLSSAVEEFQAYRLM